MNNVNFDAKNARIISALRNGEQYWILEAESEYYSLIQVGSDRMPLPVCRDLLGDEYDSLHQPELTLPRDTVVSVLRGSLLRDIVEVMQESIDDDPHGAGKWHLHKDGHFTVTTRFSRDPSRSNNGGDYYHYREFRITDAGVMAKDDWSCDIQDCEPMTTLYRLDVADLAPIVERAETILRAIRAGEKMPACPTCGNGGAVFVVMDTDGKHGYEAQPWVDSIFADHKCADAHAATDEDFAVIEIHVIG